MATVLQLLILLAALLLGVESLHNTHEVVCNHETPVCECDLQNSAGMVDVCEFSLVIERQLTFTSYEVDTSRNLRGGRGGVWYINGTTGKFEASSPSKNRPCNFDLSDPACTPPYTVDGRTFRSFIGVNGQIPGPTLIVYYNQTVVVHVTNRLESESTSIHWHGMLQRKTNFMDGVEHVTQCGIGPGSTFTYIFKADPPGTTWYHSHSGAQRIEGLFGSLIVKETSNEAAIALGDFVDDPASHTLAFIDWQRRSSTELLTRLHTKIRFFDEVDVPMLPDSTFEQTTRGVDNAAVGRLPYWSGLINGKGRHFELTYLETRLSIFNVLADTVYRFRLIGAQSHFAYRVSIDEHNLTVIATDGAFIEPVTVDYIIIAPGERYDFLLSTKTAQEIGGTTDFIIRGETLETMKPPGGNGPRVPLKEEHIAEAILHYEVDGNSNADYISIAKTLTPMERTCTADNQCLALNCPFKAYPSSYNTECLHIHQLNSLFQKSDLPDALTDNQLFFNFGNEGVGNSMAINARNLRLPSSPLDLTSSEEELNQFCPALDNDTVCDNDQETVTSDDCMCTHVRALPNFNETVQLVLSAVQPPNLTRIDNITFSHPIHLHGHRFHVIDIQFGKYNNNGFLTQGNEDIECGGELVCNNPRWKSDPDYTEGNNGKIRTNSPLKDTLLIPAGGYAVVYFQSDNPGNWLLHCHTELHLQEGMAVIIQEAADMRRMPPSGIEECGDFEWTVEEFSDFISSSGAVLISAYGLILIFCSSVGVMIGI